VASLFLGLMSGTSQDGVDAAVAEFSGQRFRRLRATHHLPYPRALRARLLALSSELPSLTLAELCELDQAVAKTFAKAALAVMKKSRLPARRITAIGSHGQTVFHMPHGRAHTSLQLGDPSLIAARTGVATVADFRRADMALGGQGAPLVPAFHHAAFASTGEARCVVNLGGIANLTDLPDARRENVTGFDIGPGNALMDEWMQRHHGRDFDRGGRWAASGTPEPSLLKTLIGDPYFRRRPPKSTGRDYFSLDWVYRRFRKLDRLSPADVQRSFAELTVLATVTAIGRHAPRARRVLVCGGGARNHFLMQRLQESMPDRKVESTNAVHLDPQWVEAAAFAWLAMRTIHGLPGNLPAVTGASGEAVLGGIYSVRR
jgi:anhydro-N-acetylmuramic acid kinase